MLRRKSFLIAMSLLLLPWAALATRVEVLRWSHTTPEEVDGFVLHYGTSPGNYTANQDLGKPSPIDDIFSYEFTVSNNQTLYVALTAYGEGFLDSFLSNEKVLLGEAPPPPPPLGGVWNEDFEELALGNVIPNWLSTGANNSLNEDNSFFRIADLSGNQVLAVSNSPSNIHSHYKGEGSQAWAEYELAGRLQLSNTTGGIGVTVYSQYPTEDGYYRLRTYNGGSFELEPHGSVTPCSQKSLGVIPQPGNWQRFRLRVSLVNSNNEVAAKIWSEGETEPEWQATCIDTSPTYQAGTIGVWSHGSGSRYWDDLEVTPLNQEPVTLPAPILLPVP